MKWVHYASLKPSAKRAFDQGNGRHGKYVIDGKYIAAIDKNSGRALDFVFVVKGGGEVITERN